MFITLKYYTTKSDKNLREKQKSDHIIFTNLDFMRILHITLVSNLSKTRDFPRKRNVYSMHKTGKLHISRLFAIV